MIFIYEITAVEEGFTEPHWKVRVASEENLTEGMFEEICKAAVHQLNYLKREITPQSLANWLISSTRQDEFPFHTVDLWGNARWELTTSCYPD